MARRSFLICWSWRRFDQLEAIAPIDLVAVRAYRLGRVRELMAAYSLCACILLDPVTIRYATGACNMQVLVFHSPNPARYVFVAQSGPVSLHEFVGCAHLAEGLETIDEVPLAITASYVAAGEAIGTVEAAWAWQVAVLMREHCGPRAAVEIERVNAALYSTEGTVARLRDAMRPGLSENELVALDVVGCHGYSCGFSRTCHNRAGKAYAPALISTFPLEAVLIDPAA